MCSSRFALLALLGLSATVAGACGGGARAVTAGTPSGAKLSSVPNTGLEVIGWMRRAHPSRALRSLSFDITTIEYRGERQVERESRAYAALPGRLRVDALPTSSRAGYVRNRQRLSVFNGGR